MAKQRSNVPKFGNWENEQNDVPYTVYFNNARKNKGGKMINPNDPQENPEIFGHLEPSPLAPATPPPPYAKSGARQEEPIGRRAVRPSPEQRDSDFGQFNKNEPNYGSGGGRASGQRSGRSARPSTTSSELSFERSPLHPQPRPQAINAMGRGIGSPAWEGSRGHDSGHGTPSRSRLRPTRSDEANDKGAAVPKFGAWDENDPQSAENFTHIFNKVREDRNNEGGSGNGPTTPNHHTSYARVQRSNEPKKCCFPWW